jgi:hypothetical protein
VCLFTHTRLMVLGVRYIAGWTTPTQFEDVNELVAMLQLDDKDTPTALIEMQISDDDDDDDDDDVGVPDDAGSDMPMLNGIPDFSALDSDSDCDVVGFGIL